MADVKPEGRRLSVRGVRPDTVNHIRFLAGATGMSQADLIDMAIQLLWDAILAYRVNVDGDFLLAMDRVVGDLATRVS